MQPWYVFAIVSTLLNGLRAFVTKHAAEQDSPRALARVAPSAVMVVLGCVVLAYRVSFMESQLATIAMAAGLQGALFYVAALSRWEALRLRTGAHVLFPIVQTSTPLVVLLSAVLFDEWLSLRTPTRLIGVLLAILAAYALVDWRGLTGDRGRGVGFAFVAMLASTGATLITKAAFEDDVETSVFAFLVLSNAVGLALGLGHNLLVHGLKPPRATTRQVLAATGIGLLNFLGLSAFLQAIKLGDLAVVASIGAVSAVIPVILAAVFDGEHLKATQHVAILLSVVALLLLA